MLGKMLLPALKNKHNKPTHIHTNKQTNNIVNCVRVLFILCSH